MDNESNANSGVAESEETIKTEESHDYELVNGVYVKKQKKQRDKENGDKLK